VNTKARVRRNLDELPGPIAINAREAAALLGLAPSTVIKMMATGLLGKAWKTGINGGGRWVVRIMDVRRHCAKRINNQPT